MEHFSDTIIMEGLAYDDVLLIPAESGVLPREVDITTHFSRDTSPHPYSFRCDGYRYRCKYGYRHST